VSTQDLLHDIGLGVVLGHMLTPKDTCVIIVIHYITYMVSLKCKIIFSITSTYITSVSCSNVGFLARTVLLEEANAMAVVALNVQYATGRNGG
jgi:hypothetical protein